MTDLILRALSRAVSWYSRRVRARHAALKTSSAWERLELVGVQRMGTTLELRNCACCVPPSTLAREVPPSVIYAAAFVQREGRAS